MNVFYLKISYIYNIDYNIMKQKKSEKYQKEQNEILEKLLKILNINEDNNVLILNNFEKNQDKVDEINSLSEDVKKFFDTGRWTYYNKKK